jgi:spore germination protein GerM
MKNLRNVLFLGMVGVLGVVAVLGVAGCAGDAGDGGGGILTDMHTVDVWFTQGEEPVAVQRRVAGAPLDGALRALVVGPTAEERADGLGSWFSADTRDVLRRVRVEDGHAVVDFRGELRDLIPGASSSTGSQLLLVSLNRTVFQFDHVEAVEYSLDGSCDAFWEWLQRSCEPVTRAEALR